MELYNILLISFSSMIVVLLIIKCNIPKQNKTTTILKLLDVSGCMTIGTREVQEDCYVTKDSPNGTLLALADGIGEPFGGRIAARTVISVVSDIFDTYNALDNPNYFFRKSFQTANREILKALKNGINGKTSLTTAIVFENKLFYAVVGNVKIAVFRNGDLVEITTGHTIDNLAREEFVTGKITRQEAIRLLESQRLYNYLGRDGFSDLELFDTPVNLVHGDVVALMSDGVYDLLTFSELEESLKKSIPTDKMALEIIQKVNENKCDNKDNASIVLLKVGSEAK